MSRRRCVLSFVHPLIHLIHLLFPIIADLCTWETEAAKAGSETRQSTWGSYWCPRPCSFHGVCSHFNWNAERAKRLVHFRHAALVFSIFPTQLTLQFQDKLPHNQWGNQLHSPLNLLYLAIFLLSQSAIPSAISSLVTFPLCIVTYVRTAGH